MQYGQVCSCQWLWGGGKGRVVLYAISSFPTILAIIVIGDENVGGGPRREREEEKTGRGMGGVKTLSREHKDIHGRSI